MTRRILGAVAVSLLLSVIATCIPPYALWLEPGSTIGHLVFRHATSHNGKTSYEVAMVAVTTCGGYTRDLRKNRQDTLWLARAVSFPLGGRHVPDNSIAYGHPPANLHDTVGPRPLTPGCYVAHVIAPPGTASLSFRLLANGQAREFTQQEHDSAFGINSLHMKANLQADEKATALCRGKYASAGHDSAAIAVVDTIVPYDTTRFARLTCADLRRVDAKRTDPYYVQSRDGGP